MRLNLLLHINSSNSNILICNKYTFDILAAVVKNNLPHVTEASEQPRSPRENLGAKMSPPKVSSVLAEVRDWWREQLAYNSDTSDD